mmetsp:Transcript_92154/g.145735  ORF Transcript_92154/g.145735 Transcript_92154/m.145735 type:complete len:120 (-) Transcript_92154:46-405(-)
MVCVAHASEATPAMANLPKVGLQRLKNPCWLSVQGAMLWLLGKYCNMAMAHALHAARSRQKLAEVLKLVIPRQVAHMRHEVPLQIARALHHQDLAPAEISLVRKSAGRLGGQGDGQLRW